MARSSSMAEYVVARPHGFTARCAVTLAWSFATVRLVYPALYRSLAVVLLPLLPDANCQDLANAAWAFGSAESFEEQQPLFDGIAARAGTLLTIFKPQELVSLLWGFSTCGNFNPVLFTGAAEVAQRMELTPQQLANLAWALTRNRPEHWSMRSTILALLPRFVISLPDFKPQELATTVLAVAKVCGKMREHEQELHSLEVQRLFTAAMQHALPQLGAFSPQSLASFATAFHTVRADVAPMLLASIGLEVLERIDQIEPSVLLLLLRVYTSSLKAFCPPPVFELACQSVPPALFVEAAGRLEAFQEQEVQILSRLCSRRLAGPFRSDLTLDELRWSCLRLGSGGGEECEKLASLEDGDNLDDGDHGILQQLAALPSELEHLEPSTHVGAGPTAGDTATAGTILPGGARGSGDAAVSARSQAP
eukprot:NODE_6191_length_1696_cov_4.943913.p1 GENE.NODE_6191_length_1696_cov_4.943913~~NODE_6191_length_1696_cov_4.943913.p1  ORF type:complete len:422 (+),score=91.90 NODE_6191_length_1696_cov_4.943913:158-1423(+)